MPNLPGINHPRFTRINRTQYTIRNPDSNHVWTLHVGQIMVYLTFDLHLRNHGAVDESRGIPMGYLDFAIAFNTGTHPGDKRTLSTIFTSNITGDRITRSTNPVLLEHFHITPEQCGFPAPKQSLMSDAQAFVFEEYATTQAIRNKRRKEAYREREEKRNTLFGRFGKCQRNDPFDSSVTEQVDDEFPLSNNNNNSVSSSGTSNTTTTPSVPTTSTPATRHARKGKNTEMDKGKHADMVE